MRAEVVAVGTELLLGQVVDTNSSWIGEQMAAAGIDSHFQTKVGDNLARIVLAIREALARADAVIVCGGLGPTQDDITREAIAEVMNAGLRRDPEILDRIQTMFDARGRVMAANNARQADVPEGATPIPQVRGTAPGLICPVGHKVVYAVPGVPHEMQEMITRAVIPDLQARAGDVSTIRSRVLRTWGLAESTLAEVLAPRLEALDADSGNGVSGARRPTLAFLASGMEGIKVRITAKAATAAEADAVLADEEHRLKELLGDVVFGVDDESMETAVAQLLLAQGLTLGVAESLTGGMVGERLTAVPGASDWFRGSIVAYDSAVKHALLGVPQGPVVTGEAAEAMAAGAARLLGADVGLGVTGVAGPTEQQGQAVGTVWMGLALDGRVESTRIQLPGDRERVRQFATISLLDLLRRRLRTRGA
jgi:nicotinamide-nucleotide amidase